MGQCNPRDEDVMIRPKWLSDGGNQIMSYVALLPTFYGLQQWQDRLCG